MRFAPKLFPGLAKLVEACWGWQAYDNITELSDLVAFPSTTEDKRDIIVVWLSHRSKVTAPLDIIKLGLEVRWLRDHLSNDAAERIFCRLGLVTPVYSMNDAGLVPYLDLLAEIEIAVMEWLYEQHVDLAEAIGDWDHEKTVGKAR